ncbi:MAG: hypothetical protein RMM98_00250 [Acidobacteriota bacterium]|nr:hypothetical protein [Blastocatellia bacterium]MDW8238018.1 hypothetical protein [Acidobacteriota bacterium]
MKRLWLIYLSVTLPALVVYIGSAATTQTNYSGTWVLDKEKTADRPLRLEGYTMVVTQDGEQLQVTLTGGRKPAQRRHPADVDQSPRPGPPGRPRGGPGPFGMALPTATYKLDGTTTTVEHNGRGRVLLKAEWKQNQTVLELSQIRQMSTPDGEFTFTTVERWELSADGQTLTVHRTSETPRGTHTSTLVFKRSEPSSR